MKTPSFLTAFALTLLTASAWAQPSLRVEAQPADALIFLNRELKGQGAVDLTDLPAGKHLLRISAGEDWETHQQTFKIDPQSQPNTLKIVLKPGAAKWLRLGQAALSRGNYKEAVDSFGHAEHARPVPAAWWLGVAHWKAGHTAQAIQSFRKYAQYMPKVPELHWILGQLYESAKQPDHAFTAYKTAALAQPELTHALDKLPKVSDQAIQQYSGKTAAADRLRLAQLLMLKGRMAEASQQARAALGVRAEEWKKQDWRRWNPPLPPPPVIEVAPAEDEFEQGR